MFYGLVWGKLFNMDDTLDHQNVPGLANIDFKFQLIILTCDLRMFYE